MLLQIRLNLSEALQIFEYQYLLFNCTTHNILTCCDKKLILFIIRLMYICAAGVAMYKALIFNNLRCLMKHRVK